MTAIIQLLILFVKLYLYAVIGAVILNWMVMLGVANSRHPLVRKVNDFLTKITDPAFKRIQQVIPPYNGFDFSPLILLVGLTLLQNILYRLMY